MTATGQRWWAAAAALALVGTASAVVAAAPDTPPVPLAPSGKWLVEGQDNMCALSHAFGEGGAQVTLAIRPWPLATTDDVLLFTRSSNGDVEDGTATIRVDDHAPSEPAGFVEYALQNGQRRLLSFRVDAATLDGLATARRVTLALGKRRVVTVAPANAAPALAVLHRCQDMLRAKLGIDMAEKARIVTEPAEIGSPSRWFSAVDYPDEALRGGAQGVTRLFMVIGTDGRIARCVAFGSSGNGTMDRAACAGCVRRGRYKPALDVAGKPVTGYVETAVRWRLGR